MLADYQISEWVEKGRLGIEPFDEDQVQPASYDMRLGSELRVFSDVNPYRFSRAIDTKEESDLTEPATIQPQGFFLVPQGFALAVTQEKVRMPSSMAARVEGKSSLARLGLLVHVTAGFIDPGFEGHITLELFCANGRGLVLYSGMPICQLSFHLLNGVAKNPYRGKYQHSDVPAPVPSRYYRNFKEHGGIY